MSDCMWLRCLVLSGWVVTAIITGAGSALSKDSSKLLTCPVRVSCDQIDFGQIEDVVVYDYTFGITNTGDSRVQITGQMIERSDNDRFSLIGNSHDFGIEPGSSMLLTVRYNPAGKVGQDTATWVAEVRSDGVWPIAVQLLGTAIDTVGPPRIGDLRAISASENPGANKKMSVDESPHFALARVSVWNVGGDSDLELTSEGSTDVHVEIVDSAGVPVKTFGLHENLAGSHRWHWDGTNNSGQTLAVEKLSWRLSSARYMARVDIIPNVIASTTQEIMTE